MKFEVLQSSLLLHSVLSGLVGLSLSYALSITNLLSGLIFSFAQTEMQLVSIERTEEYSTNIPQEPQQASIEVRGVIVSLKAESGLAVF